jgi:Spy/CpxP family protein refolding chaperone
MICEFRASRRQRQEENVSILKPTFALIAVVAALAAASAWAQEEGSEPMHHHIHGGFMGHEIGLPLHELNLSEDQRSQIHQILKSEHANLKPLIEQEMRSHQQLIQLVTGGNFDQAKAMAIAAQESQTHVQLEVEHAKIASQIYQLLNTEQKAKVAEIIEKHQQRMEQHLAHPESGAPSDEQK